MAGQTHKDTEYTVANIRTMAAAFQNKEIANMNGNLYLLCVRCKEMARFICERCSDPYCTKTCQVIDWPFHRKMCFPMPSLLEIPKERGLTSMCDQRTGDSLALTYHTNSQNQYRFAPRYSNDSHTSHNFQQMLAGQSFTKPVRQELYFKSIDSGVVEPLDLKKSNSVLEAEPCLRTVIRKEAHPSRTDADAIVNLATMMKSDCGIPLIECERKKPQKSLNRWDEDTTDHIIELQPLMSNDSRNWQKPFPLQNDTLVTVVYFVETPTVNCWVVQNQYTTKKHHLMDEIKQLHCDNLTAERQTVIINEVYSVQYEGNYFRGVCLYQTNSKEVLVRLIDVGLTFQTRISAMKNLDRRLKAIPAFALEVNLGKSSDVTIGQTLVVNEFSVDATGTVNVTLRQEVKSIESTHQTIKIETVLIPVGVPVELFCLDYSNIDKGYISACIHDPKKIESINQLSDKITDYLKQSGETGKYFPKLDEICFAYHDSERQWYRAECIDQRGADSFEVIFIDYGIMRIVNSSNLRKFASEFSQPAMMHLCSIKGIPSKPKKELAKKIANFLNENPIFSIASAKYDNGMVIIDCPKLMMAIR